MNALQAIRKLNLLQDEISALNAAATAMEDKNADSYYIRLIKEMQEAKERYAQELEQLLNETELPKQF